MKTIYLRTAIVFISLSFVSFVNAQHADRRTEKIKDDIINDLNILEKDYISLLRPYKRDEALKRLDDIAWLVNSINNDNHRHVMPEPMSPEEFNELLKVFDNTTFESERKKVLFKSAIANYFTVNQITVLMKRYTFDSDRIEIVDIFYPKIVDLENTCFLYDCLVFEMNRPKIDDIIKSYSTQVLVEPEREEHRRR